MTTRLIETWLPIAELSEESIRERRSLQALPPIYYLHVWWARRPLVASRAAILASRLPADVDRDKFLHVLGIHGDPVASRRRIDLARQKGERFTGEAYDYKRAFSYSMSQEERDWFAYETGRLGLTKPKVLDPTAGGGSVPFETVRLGAGIHIKRDTVGQCQTKCFASSLQRHDSLPQRVMLSTAYRRGGNL